jgi:hypothetical protein
VKDGFSESVISSPVCGEQALVSLPYRSPRRGADTGVWLAGIGEDFVGGVVTHTSGICPGLFDGERAMAPNDEYVGEAAPLVGMDGIADLGNGAGR